MSSNYWLKSLFWGRKYFAYNSLSSEADIIKNLQQIADAVKHLPYAGDPHFSKKYLVAHRKGEFLFKKNLPILKYIPFLPGKARTRFRIYATDHGIKLRGYHEGSMHSHLTHYFVLSSVSIFSGALFIEGIERGASALQHAAILLSTICFLGVLAAVRLAALHLFDSMTMRDLERVLSQL